MAPTCTACHHLGLTSVPEEVRSQTVSFMLLLNLRVCGELCMAPCFNGPTLMPLQPSSWYRETGCWYSWDISNPRLCLLLSEARTSFVSMRMHPARHAPTLSEECGAYERIPMAGPRETIARLLQIRTLFRTSLTAGEACDDRLQGSQILAFTAVAVMER